MASWTPAHPPDASGADAACEESEPTAYLGGWSEAILQSQTLPIPIPESNKEVGTTLYLS